MWMSVARATKAAWVKLANEYIRGLYLRQKRNDLESTHISKHTQLQSARVSETESSQVLLSFIEPRGRHFTQVVTQICYERDVVRAQLYFLDRQPP